MQYGRVSRNDMDAFCIAAARKDAWQRANVKGPFAMYIPMLSLRANLLNKITFL